MKRPLLLFVFILLIASSAFTQVPRNAKVFTVNSTADSFDSKPGDGGCLDDQGRCTLRAAVMEVVASSVPGDTIIFELPNPSVIELTLGEIVAQGDLTILGPGPDRVTIQRAAGAIDFRLFHLSAKVAGNFDLRGVTLKNGKAAQGGAIYTDGIWLYISNVVVTGNQATNGGGIFSSAGNVRIMRSLFHGNTATGVGGAILLAPGPSSPLASVISNTTITLNQAQSAGALSNGRELTLAHDTITHNSVTNDVSGVLSLETASTHVSNTIIGSNPLPNTTLSGSFISHGHNIITDSRNSSGFTNGVLNDVVGVSNSVDPMVGPLADNGGGIPTRSLLPGSIAIDAGSTFTQSPYDQRARYSRIAGKQLDIGAFELNSSIVTNAISFKIQVQPSDQSGVPYAFSPVVLTNLASGQKQYSSVNLFGYFTFYDIDLTTNSVIEVKTKRRLPLRAVVVFPNFPE